MTAFWIIGIAIAVLMLAGLLWWVVRNWRQGDR
jgi:hypothetical protein